MATAPATALRLVLFGVLGPPAGLIAGLAALRLTGPTGLDPFPGLLVLLPVTYFLGLVPALVTGLVDAVLAAHGTRYRLLLTTVTGAAVGFMPIAAAIGVAGLLRPAILLWAIIGAAPAALCAWLAGLRDP
jgi:hypothetical protein